MPTTSRLLLCSVSFDLPAEVVVSGWVALLTNLKWLSVSALHITVTEDVGGLAKLQHLHLCTTGGEGAGSETVIFAQHSIPGRGEGVR